jgi:beta-mannosidase
VEKLTLNGAWTLQQVGETETTPAIVPGCVHTDLLTAGKIPDPFYRDNELQVMWIGERDWIYRRDFTVPESLLAHERVLLHCDSLDTLATITLNGVEIGKAYNQFRVWKFDLKPYLNAGENQIEVHFAAPVKYIHAKTAQRRIPQWGQDHTVQGAPWIRKSPSNFGWDWGPRLATSGILRDITLIGFDTARICDVHVLQDHSDPKNISLTVNTVVERTNGDAVKVNTVMVALGGKIIVAEGSADIADDNATIDLIIPDAQLWWPNGMGDQPLYDVVVKLLDKNGNTLDTQTKRIGLRELKLERHEDEWGESFYFSANGVPFFSKGANWIPADQFVTTITREHYARLLKDTVAANMNMLRVWGGGIYESEDFYELCDELGICIWQDFMFSCAAYPSFDDDFMVNVKAEAEDNVRRIRHHACLALWCGNNELEQGLVADEWTESTMSWDDYGKLFDAMLPDVVKQLDPQTDYWPGSPHSPKGNRWDWINPKWGDAHLWQVWHGKQPFEYYRTCEHRFNSEFGFQSFPEPQTVYTYTLPEDHNVTSYIMEHHQRSGIGNTTIIQYMLDWFKLPTSFEMTLWLSQILQGIGIKYAVEHWRREMPRGMGTLYWQLNDCWQVASWSSIDYFGRWKALHFMAKRFYAPLLLSGVEDMETGTVALHVTSDLLEAKTGQVIWTLTDVEGKPVDNGKDTVEIAPNQNTALQTLDFKEQLNTNGKRKLLLWLELVVGGETVSDNLVTFVRPKHLELRDPEIAVEVEHLGESQYQVTLTAKKAALWVWLEVDEYPAQFSDNFVHLLPSKPVIITVTTDVPLKVEALAKKLSARSLVNTY